MTAHPLQNQATDIAVFGLSVALIGFMAKAMGSANRQPVLLPAVTHDAELEERARLIIEDLQKAVDETKKTDSIRRIERILDRIDTEILDREIITGLEDLQDAIEEYKGIEREGLTPEEYREEKESAFEAIMDAVKELEIDEEALEEEASTPSEPPHVDRKKLMQVSLEMLDRLIRDKKLDAWPVLPTSEARKVVYRDVLAGFSSLSEAREYVADQPEDNVIYTARGDEISFLLIKVVIDDIERNPWLSPFRAARPDIGRQPPLMPATYIPANDLTRIADKYGWWAARQAAALCPRDDVACVEREAKRLYEVVRLRRVHGN